MSQFFTSGGKSIGASASGSVLPMTTAQGWFPLGLTGLILLSSSIQSCPTLCDPMDCSTPGFPVYHQLLELTQTRFQSMMPSSLLILGCPVVLLPAMFPSIRVFFSNSVLCIRWPEYWSIYSIPINIFPSGLWDQWRKRLQFSCLLLCLSP